VLINISRFVQLLTMGLYTGIPFGDGIGVTPIRPKLPATSFALFQQDLHSRFGKLMPALLISSLLAGITWLSLQRRNYKSREFVFTTLATVCNLSVMILTILINVPVNETFMTWQASTPPENVMQLWAPWEGSHNIPTVIALLGFACLAYAVTTRSNLNQPIL
jgi:hypothetical protein